MPIIPKSNIKRKKVDFMKTQYDAWLEQEKQKIHNKHEEVRQKLREEAFLLGLKADHWERDVIVNKQRNAEIAEKIKAENAAEKAELEEFMKTIGEK